MEDLGAILEKAEANKYPQGFLGRDSWILTDPQIVYLFRRIMNQGTPLGKFVKGQIYRGITTGLNTAFIIDQEKYDELVASGPQSADAMKVWFRGKDIRRWHAVWRGKYLIKVQNSGDKTAHNLWSSASSEEQARGIFSASYPGIHEHLSKFEDKWFDQKGKSKTGLRVRADQGKFWWELRACDYYPEFEMPKVIWKKTTFKPAFLYDETGSYLGNTLHFIPGADWWLAALMNSIVMEFIMVLRINLLRGGYIELTPTRIENLPVPDMDEEQRASLNLLAQQAATGNTDAERQIDGIVGQAFGLSEEEIARIHQYLSVRWSFGPSEDAEDDDDDD